MTDRPILFSAPLVRALLEGRKTQTRRVLKLAGRVPEYIGPKGCEADPTCWGWAHESGGYITVEGDENAHLPGWRNGWRDWAGAYAPADRLWVKEALVAKSTDQGARWPGYEADWENVRPSLSWPWKRDRLNSMFCPRWASRLTLTVTDVRVQRLQEISNADAMGEGCDAALAMTIPRANGALPGNSLECFRDLWNSLHGPVAWDANPWVCALTFTVQRGKIDQIKAPAES